MTLTLLALFMLPVLFKMVLDPSGMYRVLKDWSNSAALQFVSAIAPMMMAMLILTTSPRSFGWDWESLLSWIAVIIAIGGISHLSPSVVKWKMRFVSEERLPIFGFLGLIFALGLVYVDTQLL